MATLHRIHPAEAATEVGNDEKYEARAGQLAVVILLCSASLVCVVCFALFAAYL